MINPRPNVSRTVALAVVAAATLVLSGAMPAGAVRMTPPRSPILNGATRTLVVGPGHRYAKPCQAITSARAGDTVEIDARGNGTYDGDVCGWSTDRLQITGINGRARIRAAGQNAQGKATWVIAGAATVIDHMELSGATAPDGNGAAIRQEGAGLTLRNSYIHDNQDGILAGENLSSDILIDSTEFAHNGAGDGYTHNIYIGRVRRFTLRYSWSHDASVGHLVKSRALTNVIAYNRLTGEGGTDSYELDLPNGGRSIVIGNIIEQGAATQNPALMAYGEEGSLNPRSSLYIVSNTIVNDLGDGTAVLVGDQVSTPVMFANNISVGSTALVTQAGARLRSNCTGARPRFVNRARYDYRLAVGSRCLNKASAVAPAGGTSLAPTSQYIHPLRHRARPHHGRLDAGAYER